MFTWFFEEIMMIIVAVLEKLKLQRLAEIVATIAGYIFLTAMTGGLWIFIDLISRMIKRRKNKKRA